MIRMMIFTSSIAISCVISPISAQSQNNFESALTTCAAGANIEISADLIGSINTIYDGGSTQGTAKLRNMGAFLEALPEADRLKAYELYTKCIKSFLDQQSSNPGTTHLVSGSFREFGLNTLSNIEQLAADEYQILGESDEGDPKHFDLKKTHVENNATDDNPSLEIIFQFSKDYLKKYFDSEGIKSNFSELSDLSVTIQKIWNVNRGKDVYLISFNGASACGVSGNCLFLIIEDIKGSIQILLESGADWLYVMNRRHLDYPDLVSLGHYGSDKSSVYLFLFNGQRYSEVDSGLINEKGFTSALEPNDSNNNPQN